MMKNAPALKVVDLKLPTTSGGTGACTSALPYDSVQNSIASQEVSWEARMYPDRTGLHAVVPFTSRGRFRLGFNVTVEQLKQT